MLWQDGVGVYQNLVVLLHLQRVLLLGTVVVAQETRTFLYILGGNACSSGDNACWIPLYSQHVFCQSALAFHFGFLAVYGQFAGLYLVQVFVTLACKVPVFQFAAEELLHFLGIYLVLPKGVQQAACLYLLRAQLVLVLVVAVYLLLTQCSIAVAFPTAAEVHFIINATYAVSATYHQPQSIVLAITGVGYLQFSQNRCVEGSWRSQSVYSQCIVSAVLWCPLSVVDEPWRQGFQLEIAHPVATYHHGGILFEEHVHHSLQCILTAIQVVAVQLYNKSSHPLVVYSHIPASSDAQVVALGYNMNYPWVIGVFLYYLRCSVCRTVVHHHQVVLEGGLLHQHALYGIGDGFGAVAHRYYHGGLYLELVAVVKLYCVELSSVQVGIDGTQVSGACPFQFHLAGTVSGVYVVKLLLARQTCVCLHFCV